MIEELLEIASKLPPLPGCYLLKGVDGQILYVGKAKKLSSRVSSYFNNSAKSPKTLVLVSRVKSVEFILTDSETEALVLENNLIKEHLPKYNVQLRSNKSYPYVFVDLSEPFPRLLLKRQVGRKKGRKIFGPFVQGSNVRKIVDIITKSFLLRDCSDREFKRRNKPCLLYQMQQCSAPCVKLIHSHSYQVDLQNAISFFQGDTKHAIQKLKERMWKLAQGEEYEHAAIIRDYVEELKRFASEAFQKSAEFSRGASDVDAVNYFIGEKEVDISIYIVRRRLLLGMKNLHFFKSLVETDIHAEILSFLHQYYTSNMEDLPSLIVTPLDEEKVELFSSALQTSVVGEAGVGKKYRRLVDLGGKHAAESQKLRLSGFDNMLAALCSLQKLLNLVDMPRVLEGYDIAIWQGHSPTAAKIVFRDGLPDKKYYRYYHLQQLPEGNNDFAMLEEVFTRRITKGNLPDIFVVDGGKQQVNRVRKVLIKNSIDIPIVGIIKAKKGVSDQLVLPGKADYYDLKANRSLWKLLGALRDEAHRFSRILHHKSEKKRVIC